MAADAHLSRGAYAGTVRRNLVSDFDKAGIPESAVQLNGFDSQHNRFRIELDLDFDIVHEEALSRPGCHKPTDSHLCGNKKEAKQLIEQEFRDKLTDPAFTDALRSELEKDPKKALTAYNEERTHAHSGSYHRHTKCAGCKGQKLRPCPNRTCVNGREPCPIVGCAHGHVICKSCNGQARITYHGADGFQKNDPCPNPMCHGGRAKCRVCGMDGQITCRTCNGIEVVPCDVCRVNGKSTGQVTVFHRANLVRRPQRRCRTIEAPHTWVTTRLGDNVSLILFRAARTENAGVSRKDDNGFKIQLDAVVPSGEGRLTIWQHESQLTALGGYPETRLDENIMENVLHDQRSRILNASGNDAFAIAGENPLFSEAAKAACTGAELDSTTFQKLIDSNALTTSFLQTVVNHLAQCVDTVMKKPYWRTLAVAAPFIVVSGSLTWFFDPLLGFQAQIEQAKNVRAWRMVTDAFVPVMLTFGTLVLAHKRGRKRAVDVLGRTDIRGPGLGRGLFAATTMVLAALTVTWTGTLGPGQGPRPLSANPGMVVETGLTNAASAIGRAMDGRQTTSEPRFETSVSQSDSRNTSSTTPEHGTQAYVKTLQRELADLGYYDGAIDGIRGPKTRRAIAQMREEARFPTFEALQRYKDKPLELAHAIQQGRVDR